MNEKIETLSRMASEYAESRMHLTGWSYTTEYNKKFAELIVQECEKSIKMVPTQFEAQDKIIVECLKSIRQIFGS